MTWQSDLAWTTLDIQYRSSVSYQKARYAPGLDCKMLPADVSHQSKGFLLYAHGRGDWD